MARILSAPTARVLSGADANPPTPTPTATPNLGQRTGAEQVAGAQKIAGAISTGVKAIQTPMDKSSIGGAIKSEAKKTAGVLESGFGTITGAAQSVLAPVTAALQPVLSKIESNVKAMNIPGANEAATALSSKMSDFAAKHPESSTLISDIANTFLLALGGKAAPEVSKGISGAIDTIPGKIKTAVEDVSKTRAGVARAEDFQKLQETIAPKTSAKTVLREGRVVPGKSPTLLKSGTADTVIPSVETSRVAKTISENIPRWNKLTTPELENALDAKITETAEKLKPEMEKVTIKPATIEKINSDWESLKKTQVDDAPADLESNVAKRQTKFEKFLQKSKSGNLNDLWDTAKEYDNSIKSNVKNVTDQSAPDIYQQHQEWLQNRRILKDAINDAENGLGVTSKTAFQQMHDMYLGQQGIESTFKLTTEGAPSKITQLANKHPYITGAVGGTIIGATGAPKAVLGAIGL